MKKPIHVFSEIGPLKQVLLHRPGQELDNLMPDYLEQLLFDDIPFLDQARREHDLFADTLRSKGVDVLYLEDLAAESLTCYGIKQEFLQEYLDEAFITDGDIRKEITDYFWFYNILCWWKIESDFLLTLFSSFQLKKRLTFGKI